MAKKQHSCSKLSLDDERDHGETADAGGEEAEEDVGRSDEPEGEDVDRLVAVVWVAAHRDIRQGLVDPVDPHAAWK